MSGFGLFRGTAVRQETCIYSLNLNQTGTFAHKHMPEISKLNGRIKHQANDVFRSDVENAVVDCFLYISLN